MDKTLRLGCYFDFPVQSKNINLWEYNVNSVENALEVDIDFRWNAKGIVNRKRVTVEAELEVELQVELD